MILQSIYIISVWANLMSFSANFSEYVLAPVIIFWARYEITEWFKRRKDKKADADRQKIREHYEALEKAYELPQKLKSKALEITKKQLVQNAELIGGIYVAADKISQNAKAVIRSNFMQDSPEILLIDLIQSAKQVKSIISYKNLELADEKAFMREIKNAVILPAAKQYQSRLASILSMKNGERLKEFENITLDFAEILFLKTIHTYNKHSR